MPIKCHNFSVWHHRNPGKLLLHQVVVIVKLPALHALKIRRISIHLGYADPFEDELPSEDFDSAEPLEEEPFSGDFGRADPFDDDFAAGPTKSEPFEDDAAIDFAVADPFEEDAASPFEAALERGFDLEIVTWDAFAGGLAETAGLEEDDEDFATPLGLGTKRVASEVDWDKGVDG